jgi:PAS domain S-box-containing protein
MKRPKQDPTPKPVKSGPSTQTEIDHAKQAEKKFRQILEFAPDAMVIVDKTGLITLVNSQAEKLFGYSRDELTGKPIEILMPEGVRNHHRDHRANFFVHPTSRAMGIGLELIGQRKDGRVFPAEISLNPLETEEGTQAISAIRDITSRKETEREIYKLNAELEKRVIERTAQLEAANRELEAFSYSVSHDLRTPLRSIHGFSQAILEDYADKFDHQGKDFLQRICGASQRMTRLMDDLLSLARVSRSDLHRKTVDLSLLAHAIEMEFKTREPDRQAVFAIRKGLVANGDSRLLRLVLENLFGNAWKFTSKHSRATIEFGMTEKNGKPAYFVRDDGVGFNMAYVEKLFNPFQRLHDQKDFDGTGIGLATVQRIINRHGGRVWAEGAIEKGATFYFTLE